MFLTWEDYIRQEIDNCKRVSRNYLSSIENRLKDIGINVRSVVLVGKPVDEILDYASKIPLNLIVMSSHGESGISRWAYGSVADKIIHRASGPVFLVRRRTLDSGQF